jgi:hypothetical protein
VSASLKTADLKALRDITAIETLPPTISSPPSPRWEWIALAAAVVLLAAGGCLVLLLRRGGTARAAVSPEQWALHRLERLSKLNHHHDARLTKMHALLANLVRGYLSRRWQVPARRRTTAETLADVQAATAIALEDKVWLKQILLHCDQVRFARQGTTPRAWEAALGQTRRFLQASPSQNGEEKTKGA